VRPHDEKMREMLHEFGRAVLEAISASEQAAGSVRRIRDQGFSLYLVLDGPREKDPAQRLELASRQASPAAEPAFRINGEDVAILKSLGIDPTRTVRRRRGSRAP